MSKLLLFSLEGRQIPQISIFILALYLYNRYMGKMNFQACSLMENKLSNQKISMIFLYNE